MATSERRGSGHVTFFDERLGESPTWSLFMKNTFIEFDDGSEQGATAVWRERSAPACAHRDATDSAAIIVARRFAMRRIVGRSRGRSAGRHRAPSSRASTRSRGMSSASGASSCASARSNRSGRRSERSSRLSGRRTSEHSTGRSSGRSSCGRSSCGRSSGRSSRRWSGREKRRSRQGSKQLEAARATTSEAEAEKKAAQVVHKQESQIPVDAEKKAAQVSGSSLGNDRPSAHQRPPCIVVPPDRDVLVCNRFAALEADCTSPNQTDSSSTALDEVALPEALGSPADADVKTRDEKDTLHADSQPSEQEAEATFKCIKGRQKRGVHIPQYSGTDFRAEPTQESTDANANNRFAALQSEVHTDEAAHADSANGDEQRDPLPMEGAKAKHDGQSDALPKNQPSNKALKSARKRTKHITARVHDPKHDELQDPADNEDDLPASQAAPQVCSITEPASVTPEAQQASTAEEIPVEQASTLETAKAKKTRKRGSNSRKRDEPQETEQSEEINGASGPVLSSTETAAEASKKTGSPSKATGKKQRPESLEGDQAPYPAASLKDRPPEPVRQLTDGQAEVLASLAIRGNELLVTRYISASAHRCLLLAIPVDYPEASGADVLKVQPGDVVHCEAIDHSGWGFGTVVAPASQAGQRGCFQCKGMRPVIVELHHHREGETLGTSRGTWGEVERLQGPSTQNRLRQKATLNRMRLARAGWEKEAAGKS